MGDGPHGQGRGVGGPSGGGGMGEPPTGRDSWASASGGTGAPERLLRVPDELTDQDFIVLRDLIHHMRKMRQQTSGS